MIAYEEALEKIQGLAEPFMRTEQLALSQAKGRVLAQDISAKYSNPRYPTSAMDGFAFRFEDTESASIETPVRLRVLSSISAGDPYLEIESQPFSAVEIMTGAVVPDGYNAVAKVEDVEVARDENGELLEVVISRPHYLSENVRQEGEDCTAGDTLVKKGTLLEPQHILSIATQGYSELCVFRKIRIALVSTGSEVVSVYENQELGFGKIYNSSGPFLSSFFPEGLADIVDCGIVSDSIEEFCAVMRNVLSEGVDVVLTTGAVSMGIHDFIPSALRELGAEIIFHKTSIKPGKPILVAKFPGGGPICFSLPGNPISGVVGARFFVEPFLRRVLGLPKEKPYRATLKSAFRKRDGLRNFVIGNLSLEGNSTFEAFPKQQSFKVSPLAASNAWAVIPEDGADFAEGTEVECFALFSNMRGSGVAV